METYAITGEHVLFAKPSNRIGYDGQAITLSKKIVLECVEAIKEMDLQKTMNDRKSLEKEWIETSYLCPNCNNYGFPSIYNFIEFDRKIGLCTSCANRLRADGRHTVTKNEIRKK
ncbi:MAG: hypothetical protein E3J47_08285 [Candidatus Stahlbacteria bacterium]|nr:MAG: hypothetical protein E3J47_08285 [Candidatus Stahlbacteria bacterium]